MGSTTGWQTLKNANRSNTRPHNECEDVRGLNRPVQVCREDCGKWSLGMTGTVIGSVHNVEDVTASNRAPNEAEATDTDEMNPETPAGFTLPLYQFWYMHHAYRKELEQFEKQHGVSICAEVSVSIKHIQRSSPDSVSKTTADFQTLVQRCTDSFSDAAINHNHMDSDIVKQALHDIQSEETRMMFTMSASNCLFFGPKKFTDVIKRVEEMKVESQFNNSRPTQDDTKHRNFTMDRPYLQPEEVIGAAGVESPQPSAPLDTAKFIIKVDRSEPFPDRWTLTLQKALQVWLSKMQGTASVLSLELMDDQSCAEVQITPSTGDMMIYDKSLLTPQLKFYYRC
ncbi:uncharacterized protein [Chanodichthys erythropterus]|uniref:uncharacterized protein n=1 Tax=Chanodichthys erythropterus TaxID=933992 RepID=UPI00351E8DC2